MTADDDIATEIGELLLARRARIGVAESLTGGLLVQALARTSGSGDWLVGGVVAYATSVKRQLLDVTAPNVVSAECALQLTAGVRRRLDADVAIAVTGVGGPEPQDGEPPGTVWIAVHDGHATTATLLHAEGDPSQICAVAVSEALRLAVAALRHDVQDDDPRQA
jgi:PncC family amidohydrolase